MVFLLEALSDLNTQLTSLSPAGLRLVVAKGNPQLVFTKLCKLYAVQSLTFEGERVEPYGRQRDKEIREMCKRSGVDVEECFTHTLFDQEYLFQKGDKSVPGSYNGFLGLLSGKSLKPDKPVDTLEGIQEGDLSLPADLADPKVTSVKVEGDDLLEFYAGIPNIGEFKAFKGELVNKKFKGGETQAIALLGKNMKRA